MLRKRSGFACDQVVASSYPHGADGQCPLPRAALACRWRRFGLALVLLGRGQPGPSAQTVPRAQQVRGVPRPRAPGAQVAEGGAARAQGEGPLRHPQAARRTEVRGLREGHRPGGPLDLKGSCVKCHATVFRGEANAGVSCESCHGPASGYNDLHQRRAPTPKAVAAGMRTCARSRPRSPGCAWSATSRPTSGSRPPGIPPARPSTRASRLQKLVHWSAAFTPDNREHPAFDRPARGTPARSCSGRGRGGRGRRRGAPPRAGRDLRRPRRAQPAVPAARGRRGRARVGLRRAGPAAVPAGLPVRRPGSPRRGLRSAPPRPRARRRACRPRSPEDAPDVPRRCWSRQPQPPGPRAAARRPLGREWPPCAGGRLDAAGAAAARGRRSPGCRPRRRAGRVRRARRRAAAPPGRGARPRARGAEAPVSPAADPHVAAPALRGAPAALVPAELGSLKRAPALRGHPGEGPSEGHREGPKYMHFGDLAARRTVVLREGDYGDSAYYIVEGRRRGAARPTRAPSGSARRRTCGAAPTSPAGAARGARPGAEGMLGRGPGPRHRHPLGRSRPSWCPADARSSKPARCSARSARSRATRSRPPCVAARRPLLLQIRAARPAHAHAASRRSSRSSSTRATASARWRATCERRAVRRASTSAFDRPAASKKAELVSFEPGQVIVEEGAPADAFYLVRGGYVKVAVHAGTRRARRDLPAHGRLRRRGRAAARRALAVHAPGARARRAGQDRRASDFQACSRASRRSRRAVGRDLARLKERGAAAARARSRPSYMQMAMDTGLIHGESVLLIDLTTCTRCDECVRGCADAHGGEPRFIREGAEVPQLAGPHRLLPVHRPGLHDGLPDRRDHARRSARSRSRSTSRHAASAATTAPSAARGATSSMVEPAERARREARSSSRPSATCASGAPRDRPACRCARTARRCASRSRTWSG